MAPHLLSPPSSARTRSSLTSSKTLGSRCTLTEEFAGVPSEFRYLEGYASKEPRERNLLTFSLFASQCAQGSLPRCEGSRSRSCYDLRAGASPPPPLLPSALTLLPARSPSSSCYPSLPLDRPATAKKESCGHVRSSRTRSARACDCWERRRSRISSPRCLSCCPGWWEGDWEGQRRAMSKALS